MAVFIPILFMSGILGNDYTNLLLLLLPLFYFRELSR
nr:hypothetical protein [Rickettsia australis]